jgi:hypothetical protein
MVYNLIRIVGDRQAGFILCLIVILNLIVGSLVMNGHPELYPSFAHLDLNSFFRPVRSEHAWLYALLVTFSLFGINLLACIIESVIRLLDNKAGRLKASAALLFHVALVVTMAAHLYEGFYASTQRIPIGAEGVELPELGNVKVESLKNSYHPDDSLKDTEATLSFSKPGGQRISKDISYNQPAVFDAGRRQVVMLDSGMAPVGVSIIRDTDRREFRLETDKPLALENGSLMLQGLFQTEDGFVFAQILSQSAEGRQQRHIMALDTGNRHSRFNLDGAVYQFNAVIETPSIIAIVRYNPAIPLMLVSLVLASAATLLLIVWLRARSRV